MIIILKNPATEKEIEAVSAKLKEHGYTPNITRGTEDTIIAAIGTPSLQEKDLVAPQLRAMDAVERVLYVSKPYKMVSRESHPENTRFQIGDHPDATPLEVGGEKLAIMAGAVFGRELGRHAVHRRRNQKSRRNCAPRRRVQTAHFAL